MGVASLNDSRPQEARGFVRTSQFWGEYILSVRLMTTRKTVAENIGTDPHIRLHKRTGKEESSQRSDEHRKISDLFTQMQSKAQAQRGEKICRGKRGLHQGSYGRNAETAKNPEGRGEGPTRKRRGWVRQEASRGRPPTLRAPAWYKRTSHEEEI